MKKIVLAIIALPFLATGPVIAQTMGSGGMGPGMMTESQQQLSNVPNQTYLQHMQANPQANMMMNRGYGMMGGGSNMMGNYGMMPMMGGGYGMTPCTTGGSYNMMRHNGMMSMMGGLGMMQTPGLDNLKKYETFAKETRNLRKKLHDLMFDYGEARWNPDTTVGELNKMAEEMNQLRQDIQKKMSQ
jgi:hypothetical protein